MGCCWGKSDAESSSQEDRNRVYRSSTESRVQRRDIFRDLEHVDIHRGNIWTQVQEREPLQDRENVVVPRNMGVRIVPGSHPVGKIQQVEEDGITPSSHHNEERQFFQLFFSLMDHVPGYQGIQRRWEREDQRALHYNAGRCEMGNVWLDRSGYVKTLQRVKMFVSNKSFSRVDRSRLSEWALKVVKRRAAEYKAAEGKGKADPKHRKVLEEWRAVRSTLQNLL